MHPSSNVKRPARAKPEHSTTVVVPLAAEELKVTARQREKEKIRVTKTVAVEDVTVEASSVAEDVHVERVAVNRPIDTAPAIRTEGLTTIIPIVEEVVTIQKRLVLTAEIRVTKTPVRTLHPLHAKVRRELVNIERIQPAETQAEGPPEKGKPS
jgi:uncharacterized protein (TIGR02271 family)